VAESIGASAVRNSSYLLLRKLVGNVIRFAAVAVLARQLPKPAFGIVATAIASINIMVVFGSAGINSWVIYDREPGWEQRVKSAWWLNFALTTFQISVAGGLVPVVVWLYDQPELGPILLVLIATFFIEQMDEVPDALLRRHMDFRTVALRDVIYDLLTGVGGVIMALAGWGVWSLVLPRAILAPIFVVITMRLAHWTPGWNMLRGDWRRILKYTKHLIGSDMLHVVGNDGDTLIVARIFGSASVAVYNLAYVFANVIGRNVTAVLMQVSTPVLAKVREATKLRDASADIGDVCVRMYRMIALMTTPLLFGMMALSDDLVAVLYGPKWMTAVPLLRLFIVFTLVRAITSPSGAIFRVTGRTERSLRNTIFLVACVLTGVVVGSQFSILGAAAGVTCARVVVGFSGFASSLEVVGVRPIEGFKAIVPPFVAALVMAAVVVATRFGILQLGGVIWLRLGVTIPLGGLVYFGVLRAISASAFEDVVNTVEKLSGKAGKLLRRFAKSPLGKPAP
jgi:PST family polysaccharide transporter